MGAQVKSDDSITFVVPLVPPSVNHYKEPVWCVNRATGQRELGYKLTPEAKAYKQAVVICAPRGKTLSPGSPAERNKVRYGLYVRVFLGRGGRQDGDNSWKCIADGLQDAGVIHSDGRVRVWNMEVCDEDRGNPRTEITASIVQRPKPVGNKPKCAVRRCPKPGSKDQPSSSTASPPRSQAALRYANGLCAPMGCTPEPAAEWWKHSKGLER